MKSWHIHNALSVLENGGIIAYPTEAVMGLGCDPWDEDAVAEILRLKRRPAGKGLIIAASNINQLSELVDFSRVPALEGYNRFMARPGHLAGAGAAFYTALVDGPA